MFILLITKVTDKNAIIKKDKKTIPKDFKFDLRPKICLIAIIKDYFSALTDLTNWKHIHPTHHK